MFNLAFCDDDKQFLSILVPEVESIFRFYKTRVRSDTFNNGKDLITAFSKYEPYYNVIFLDIELPNENGKEIARELRILDKKFKLVFITAYPQEALNTFQYDVVGFLPKTMLSERLNGIIKLVIDKIKEDDPKEQIFQVHKVDKNLKKNSDVIKIKIPLDDIMYFECVNRLVYVYTKRETFLLHNCRFSDIVNKYTPLDFVDIHRTCIVNIKYIYSVEKLEVRLDNGICLPLSRRKRQKIFDKFSEILSKDD
ncbi:MAG: Stage 0 sporulation A-like protein [Clostridium sp.]|jgi:DNA-binding LytR/AlgR family response regulator